MPSRDITNRNILVTDDTCDKRREPADVMVECSFPTDAELGTDAALLDTVVAILTGLLSLRYLEPVVASFVIDPYDPRDLVRIWLIPRVFSAIVAVTVVFGTLRLRHLSLRTIGIKRQGIGHQVFAGVCTVPFAYGAVLLTAGLAILLQNLSGHSNLVSYSNELKGQLMDATAPGIAFGILIAGAVQEEILFRGIVLTRLRRVLGKWRFAVVISSIIFSATHLDMGYGQALSAFGLSIVWSCLYIRLKSILSTIVGHLVFNSMQVFIVPATLLQ